MGFGKNVSDHCFFNGVAAEPVGQREARIEGVEMEEITVGADGRARSRPPFFIAVVDARGGARGKRLNAFRKSRALRRKVDDQPMQPDALRRLRIRRIGIVGNENEGLGVFRYVDKDERRRQVFGFLGVLHRNFAAVGEGGAPNTHKGLRKKDYSSSSSAPGAVTPAGRRPPPVRLKKS